MKKIIIEYYCDSCDAEIITTPQEGLPQVTVQAVEEAMTTNLDKRTYLRNVDIHMCEECMETYMNRLPLKYDAGNNRPVWKGNPRG